MTDKKRYSFTPSYAVPPGWILEDEIKARNMSRDELARLSGRSKEFIAELIAGKAALDKEMAHQLKEILGISATIWMNLEKTYRTRMEVNNDKKDICPTEE